MSRPAVAAICAAVLLAGFIAGRVSASGSTNTETVTQTIERSVVVPAQHVGSAHDPRERGPLDLVRVAAVRRGPLLVTTITAARPWRDSLLRRGGAGLSLLYDTDNNGKLEHKDVVFVFRGELTTWIADYGQGVQAADVTRRSATTISVARDATIFYNGAGEATLLGTEPIGVAVVAHWKGGGDRLPDRGWITVAPPAG